MQFLNTEMLLNFLGPFGFLTNYVFWQNFLLVTQKVLISLSIFFSALIVWVLIKIWPHRLKINVGEGMRAHDAPQKQSTLEEEDKKKTRQKWDAVIKKVEASGSGGYSIAVIEADILVEETMGRLGLRGKNIAERLRSLAPGELPSLDDVWSAHKLRNKIAHEHGFVPSREETMRALTAYKKGLGELGAI